ncbi:hypothetical protein [Sinorhizobium meliloti]|uniref:hypothetical protein n=1 Tax=Rhizobium meliloti TaxID=382 RepID=UPI000B499DC7|nr:hypothetical protein [Sinorhizobium meliloti]ASQ13113.1 hypothetical protein CDO22_24495 [Sinorhizobium meliloti]MQU83079.1 hypothetical protein [Sinorhizobium meliloti]MQU86277.1 hypothetical protein [Sinorhizobium meliloti]
MSGKSEKNIFTDAYEQRLAWNKESDEFAKYAKYVIERRLDEAPGFAEIAPFVPHFVDTDPRLPGWVQVRFGSRPMGGRRTGSGGIAFETGPTLVYSRGPTGEMAVIMYPIGSQVASVPEDSLVLRIGYYDYWDLYLGVRQDMRDLMAYAYVTSIDLKPTLGQSLRIRWLRFASRQHVDGKHQYSPLRTGIWTLLKLAGSGTFSGVFRVATPLAIGWFVGRYGTDWLTSWFR